MYRDLFIRVKVYSFSLSPKLEGESIRLGSVEIAQVDPIRRFFVGAAPFILGVSIIIFLLYELVSLVNTDNKLLLIITIFVIFEISNSMFSSKKDMEGAGGLIVASSVCVVLYNWLLSAYIHFSLPYQVYGTVNALAHQLSIYLFIPVGIDIILFLGIGFILKIFFHR